MALFFNTSVSIVNCTYESNSSPDFGSALMVTNFCDVTVSHTTFLANSAPFGGAVFVFGHSSLVILNCYYLNNIAPDIGKINFNNELQGGEGGGGGLLIVRSVLKIFQSRFYNNFAVLNGGSVLSTESSLLIKDSQFENNIAALSGSAIMILNHSSVIIENSSLMNNSVLYQSTTTGGVLSMYVNCTAKISGVHFSKNRRGVSAVGDGQITIINSSFEKSTSPVIFVRETVSLQMDHCWVFNNSALTGNSGGAVSVSSSSMIVTNSSFNHNTEGNFYVELTDASFSNCSFTDNSALKGGALTAVNSNIQLIACNFTRNSATHGGAFSMIGNLIITDCVMKNNTAGGDGGVGYLEEPSKITITTSIFSQNSADGSGGVLWIKKCNMSMLNSSFVNNMALTNGGVIDADYLSLINISQATCYGNKAGEGGVLYGRAANVSISDSVMQQNVADCALSMHVSSVLEISFSQVNRNKTGALCAFNSSLLILKNSLFKENTAHLGQSVFIGTGQQQPASISLYSSTGYIENCTFIGNQGLYAGAISISTSDLRLSHARFLQNMVQQVADININAASSTFLNRIFTYRCLMRHRNKTLKSNATNFKQIAIKEHFINEIYSFHLKSNLAIEETQFASSKFLCSNFCLFVYISCYSVGKEFCRYS